MKTKLPAVFFLLCAAAANAGKEDLPGLDFDDPELRGKIVVVVVSESARANLDPLLVVAVMRVESNLNPKARANVVPTV